MAGPRRRTVRDLRRNNRATVLRKLYFDGPLSRQELGPLTALSSGSISNVVSELVADGLLEEAGSVDSDGGRPRTLLRVAPHCGHLAGVDIGETRVRVELFDLTLNELACVDAPCPTDTMTRRTSYGSSRPASRRCSARRRSPRTPSSASASACPASSTPPMRAAPSGPSYTARPSAGTPSSRSDAP